MPGKPVRALLTAGLPRPAGADRPASEQAGQVWDLGVFGHRWRLPFTGTSQPWLAQAAKAWTSEELPQHRCGGASNVRTKVNALPRLWKASGAAATTAWPPSGWTAPTSRRSATGWPTLSRTAQSAATTATRSAEALAPLGGIRALGLTRPGQDAGASRRLRANARTSPPNQHGVPGPGSATRDHGRAAVRPLGQRGTRPRSGPRPSSVATPAGGPKRQSPCR